MQSITWTQAYTMTPEQLASTLGKREGKRIAQAVQIYRALQPAPEERNCRTPEDSRLHCDHIRNLEHEVFLVLPLNVHCRLIGSPIQISQGDVDGTDAGPRAVLRHVVRTGATSFIVAHNHPSGDPTPSSADRAATAKLAQAGRALDLPLVDHLIVTPDADKWTSLRRTSPALFT